ncbi:hypothetical protein NYZ99_17215 [Maribacter litopenaei]|uniref:Uncharacterized protein n=1 Tax=Maribacter litopenaei TaxID=2976127 RepID=A0ABY5YCA5_9FLAO|nr:hypothetical protein [Maribacter litopenaei]UWX56636.1 hypothetical protein NYZ99_17215 [Maribacter litopenaei]
MVKYDQYNEIYISPRYERNFYKKTTGTQ